VTRWRILRRRGERYSSSTRNAVLDPGAQDALGLSVCLVGELADGPPGPLPICAICAGGRSGDTAVGRPRSGWPPRNLGPRQPSERLFDRLATSIRPLLNPARFTRVIALNALQPHRAFAGFADQSYKRSGAHARARERRLTGSSAHPAKRQRDQSLGSSCHDPDAPRSSGISA
jgi:hypothetical protein